MGTVPTNTLEARLRGLYLRWVKELPEHQDDLHAYVEEFRASSMKLINEAGTSVARLGALSGFPTPKMIDLSPRAGVIYDEMHQAVIKAGIASGMNAREIATQIMTTGVQRSYYQLERLARTEVVSAYWQNTWDSAEGLGLEMVWSAEESARTCAHCLSKHGMVVTDKTIRDHPNGRCTLVPRLPSKPESFKAPRSGHIDPMPKLKEPRGKIAQSFRAMWPRKATVVNAYWRRSEISALSPALPTEVAQGLTSQGVRVPSTVDGFMTQLATDFQPISRSMYVYRAEAGDFLDTLELVAGMPMSKTPLATSLSPRSSQEPLKTLYTLKLPKGTRVLQGAGEGELILLPGSRLHIVRDGYQQTAEGTTRLVEAIVEPPVVSQPFYGGGLYHAD